MEVDLLLCEDCGTTLDAIASCCEALGECISLEVIYKELCAVCRPALVSQLT